MKLGRKSLLFGVHNFFWHPLTVLIAWWKLYGRPSFKELVCIIIHDWGYFNALDMDGVSGKKHPELGARLALKWFGKEYHDLCLYHSRSYAKKDGVEPSKLCWADKLSLKYETWFTYLPRAVFSGELKEYRDFNHRVGLVPLSVNNKEWFAWLKSEFCSLAVEKQCEETGIILTGSANQKIIS